MAIGLYRAVVGIAVWPFIFWLVAVVVCLSARRTGESIS